MAPIVLLLLTAGISGASAQVYDPPGAAGGRTLRSVGVGAIVGAQTATAVSQTVPFSISQTSLRQRSNILGRRQLQSSTSNSASRKLRQIDLSQLPGIPTPNPFSTGGSSNTANYFSSGPGDIRRIGAIGFGSSVGQAGSFSAADTTVVAGVTGDDNLPAGSGSGYGSGSGSIGSNRGYTSTGGRKLQEFATIARTGVRGLLQRSSVAAVQPTRADTSTSLLGTDRSAGSIAVADLDTQRTGYGSGSMGTEGTLSSGNA